MRAILGGGQEQENGRTKRDQSLGIADGLKYLHPAQGIPSLKPGGTESG